jgi:hypothetical protein
MLTAARREGALALICLVAIVATMFVPPIPQDPAYHAFVDNRTLAGIPNFWNVVSNVGYLIVGIYGLTLVRRLPSRELLPGYLTFCIAVGLVAFGSAWYHYDPSTETLVWDRLPISVGFMALFALLLGERISWKLAQALLWPLVIVGMATVFYWAWTEAQGAGDLRPYVVVQFLPILLMPMLLVMFPGSRRSAMWLWYTFAGYVIAKIAEHFDARIYDAVGLGGHSIKHLVSAIAVLFALHAMLEMKVPPQTR